MSETLIANYEEALRSAMLAGDTQALDDLLDNALVFTGANGQVLSKAEDLAAHRSKLLQLERLDVYETQAQRIGEMIVVTTKARLAGRYDSTPFAGAFAYTRVWRQSADAWKVVVGHASMVG
jgi:hypothetical protein